MKSKSKQSDRDNVFLRSFHLSCVLQVGNFVCQEFGNRAFCCCRELVIKNRMAHASVIETQTLENLRWMQRVNEALKSCFYYYKFCYIRSLAFWHFSVTFDSNFLKPFSHQRLSASVQFVLFVQVQLHADINVWMFYSAQRKLILKQHLLICSRLTLCLVFLSLKFLGIQNKMCIFTKCLCAKVHTVNRQSKNKCRLSYSSICSDPWHLLLLTRQHQVWWNS